MPRAFYKYIASEPDRKRFKIDPASSREYHSWSNKPGPRFHGRASPDAKNRQSSARNAFVHLQARYFKSVHAEWRTPFSESSCAELASAPGRRPASHCMRHGPCRASAASGKWRRAHRRAAAGILLLPSAPTSSTRHHCYLPRRLNSRRRRNRTPTRTRGACRRPFSMLRAVGSYSDAPHVFRVEAAPARSANVQRPL
jgi:hypothetical protein